MNCTAKRIKLPVSLVTILIAAAICILGVLLYANSIHSPFHYDSIVEIQKNQNMFNVGLRMQSGRSLSYLSFAINNYVSGMDDLRSWHYVNIGLHISCALLLFFLTALLSKMLGKHRLRIALPVSLIFLVHPLSSEPVNYIWQRQVLLYSFFTLLATYVTALLQSNTLTRAKSAGCLCGIAACILLGMFSKEVGIFFVPAGVFVCVLVFSDAKRTWKTLLLCGIIAVAILVVVSYLRNYVPEDVLSSPLVLRARDLLQSIRYVVTHIFSGERGFYQHLLTQSRVFMGFVLLFLSFSARWLTIDHDVSGVDLSSTVLIIKALLPFFGVLGFAVSAFFIRRKKPLFSFFALWALMGYLPYFLRGWDPALGLVMCEYKSYLPLMGFAGMFVVLVSDTIPLRPRVLLFVALVVFSASQTYARNSIWQDNLTLWNDAIMKSPNKARPYDARGKIYHDKGDYVRADADFLKAIEINEEYSRAYLNRGATLAEMGKLEEALASYGRGFEANIFAPSPDYRGAHFNVGLIYFKQGDYDKAIRHYSKALEMTRLKTEGAIAKAIFVNRGVAFYQQGNYQQALFDYNQALTIDGQYLKAYVSRGNVYRALGKYEHALRDFNQSLILNDAYGLGYYNRGLLHAKIKHYTSAAEDLLCARNLGVLVPEEVMRKVLEAGKYS